MSPKTSSKRNAANVIIPTALTAEWKQDLYSVKAAI